jgi:hypothetical protein
MNSGTAHEIATRAIPAMLAAYATLVTHATPAVANHDDKRIVKGRAESTRDSRRKWTLGRGGVTVPSRFHFLF